MGKSQVENQKFSTMDIDNSHPADCRSTSGIWSWDGMSCTKSSAMLDACHNHLRQDHQRMVIGSPPPKPTSLIADVGDSAHYGDAIFSLHVPTADGENNNCGSGATSSNAFAIGGGSTEKIPGMGMALENYIVRRNGESVEDVVLPARVQGLHLHEGTYQQPIIVYEEIDASDESDASATIPDEGSALSLAVPTVDVHEEKKRPPLPDMDVSC